MKKEAGFSHLSLELNQGALTQVNDKKTKIIQIVLAVAISNFITDN